MPNILHFSDAVVLGLHAMAYLAQDTEQSRTIKEIAAQMQASEAHLAKVMQRLARAGYVRSTRGPKGGFRLARDTKAITLLAIFEAIEGALATPSCLLGEPVCFGDCCVLGNLLEVVDGHVRSYLSKTRLCDLEHLYRGLPAS